MFKVVQRAGQGCAIFFIGVVVLAFIVQIFDRGVDAPTPAPMPVPTFTSTPSPTETPEPTSTPDDTEVIRVYLEKVLPYTAILPEVVHDIGILSKDPRVGEPSWDTGMSTGVAILEEVNRAISEVEPPEIFSDAHVLILGSTADCAASAKLIHSGFVNHNRSEHDQAVELAKSCTSKLVSAKVLIQAAGYMR